MNDSTGETYSTHVVPCRSCRRQGSGQDFFAGLDTLEGNDQAIRAVKSWAEAPSGWLVLLGPPGTGKTRLLAGALSTLAGRPRQPLMAVELLDLWKRALDTDDFDWVFAEYCQASFAVVDDLGLERPTDWAVERLGKYLEVRYKNALPTLLTTNLGKPQIEARLGLRIASRVFDQGTGLVRVISLTNPSFREVSEKIG